MKKVSLPKRLLVMLLALVMVVGIAPVINLSEVLAAEEDPIVIIAGSDFQHPDGHNASANQVTKLLNTIKSAGYTSIDGFFFAGDYDYQLPGSANGISKLQTAMRRVYGTSVDEIYVQGNHDPDDLVFNGTLSPSYENDTENYGVFVINEMDYMWDNDDRATIEYTATVLNDYLDAKVAENYNKPIFVISHLPLHYTMRTIRDGDGKYANYLFDALNDGGAEGLNIIFIYGHNHSNGWDDYLGGSSVYLAKGDNINIARNSQTYFRKETLNFTYMNAGYVGYYQDVNAGAQCSMTMAVFEITDTKVVVKRYSESGLHELKSKGVPNTAQNEHGYSPDTKVYSSPQTITLVLNTADDTALKAAIAIAEGVNAEEYTKESYAVLEAALNAAKAVLAKTNATQAEMDAAEESLNAAINALEAAETTDPTEPSEPTNPTEPSEPTNPTEPSNPTNPTEPSEPTNPTEPSDPTNPTEPSVPTDPTEDPTDPTQAPTKAPENPTDVPEEDTTQAPTDAPVADKDADEEPKSNAGLIIGIIAAVLVAGAVVFFVIKKKRA